MLISWSSSSQPERGINQESTQRFVWKWNEIWRVVQEQQRASALRLEFGVKPHAEMGWHYMKSKKFEQQFDEGVDITALLNLSKAKRVLQVQKRVNVDFPTWMIRSLDHEAS
jgi:hypothetical protein